MKTGLILEGGAMRGMFTAGVIDVFMEQGITFDGAIGVSAGAAFGCSYKSGQIGRPRRYNKKYCRDWRYCSLRSLITTGDLYGVDFCYYKIPFELDKFDIAAYRANPMEFHVVATDAVTGKAVYKNLVMGDGEDTKWFQASASMPALSRAVSIGGKDYFDGGCADSVPLAYFELIGYDRNVVVLTQPRGYRKHTSSLMPLIKLLLRKYPAVAQDLATRADRYNEDAKRIEERVDKGEIIAIYPPSDLGIGKMEKNPDELERVYQIGRKTAEEKLPLVRSFLQQKQNSVG